MTELNRNQPGQRENPISSDGPSEKPAHRDTNVKPGQPTVPANEETEGATNALEAPPPPPEMAKGGEPDRT
jgi:hypothetical protein